MKNIQGIQLIMESNEELLPDFFMDFPYICSCVEFDKYIDPVVPWHWHHAVELFYIKSGRVEYTTPNGYSRRGQAGLLIPMYCIHQE